MVQTFVVAERKLEMTGALGVCLTGLKSKLDLRKCSASLGIDGNDIGAFQEPV